MARLPRDKFSRIGDDIAPGFDLIISDKDTSEATPLFDAVRPLIASVMFEDDEEMSSMLELIVINQPETSAGEPVNWRAVIDSKAFQEGNTIDLKIGYGSERLFMDRVEITRWLPRFNESGPGDLQIKGYDGRHRMMKGNAAKGKKSRKTFYRNTPDELIVKKIAAKYGFHAIVDATEAKKKAVVGKDGKKQHVFRTRVQQSDTTDWQFLQKLADLNRFDLWVDWSQYKKQWIVHFAKREDAGDAFFKFTYNGEDGSLISAEPDFSITDQATDVEVLFYDRKKQKVERTIISETTKGEEVVLSGKRTGPGQLQAKKEVSVGARVRFTAFGEVVEAFANRPFKSRKEAQNFVQNWLREREREFLIMQGTVIGLPELRARQVHELSGLGARLDGFYRFTNVKHKLVTGQPYLCEFTASKILSEDLSRRKPTTKAVKSAKK